MSRKPGSRDIIDRRRTPYHENIEGSLYIMPSTIVTVSPEQKQDFVIDDTNDSTYLFLLCKRFFWTWQAHIKSHEQSLQC